MPFPSTTKSHNDNDEILDQLSHVIYQQISFNSTSSQHFVTAKGKDTLE